VSKQKNTFDTKFIFYAVVDALYNTLDRRHIVVTHKVNKDEEYFNIVFNNSTYKFPTIKEIESNFNIKLDYLYETASIHQ